MKSILIDFLVNSPFFFFLNGYETKIYNFFLNLSYFYKYSGFNDLKVFFDFYMSKNELFYESFYLNYFHTKRFLKLIFINSNLPIFFYFGLLFIFSTIFSLIFMSYLGLYGVFFINLVTIITF